MQKGYSKKKPFIFWLAKYKVFDTCDFLAMLLKGKDPLLLLLLFLLIVMCASSWTSHSK